MGRIPWQFGRKAELLPEYCTAYGTIGSVVIHTLSYKEQKRKICAPEREYARAHSFLFAGMGFAGS